MKKSAKKLREDLDEMMKTFDSDRTGRRGFFQKAFSKVLDFFASNGRDYYALKLSVDYLLELKEIMDDGFKSVVDTRKQNALEDSMITGGDIARFLDV